jgi:hypothetical protein
MRSRLCGLVVAVLVLCGLLLQPVGAGPRDGNHYINGVEGIKAGSVPPPGLYLRNYVAFYQADTLKGPDGMDSPAQIDVSVFAIVPRLIWVSNKEFLGAQIGADALFGLIYTDIELTPPGAPMSLEDDNFAFYDIYVEPLLMAWHGKQWDIGFGLSCFIPTGESGDPADPGKDYWTGMATLGGTYFLDENRTWSASLLGRYETHGERDSDNVRLGDDFHFEWGVAKTVKKTWDVGLAGYSQWQVTDDDAAVAGGQPGDNDSVHAVGPEISGFCPTCKLFVSLRSLWEMEAKDRTQGNITTLTVTKIL